MNSGYLTYNNGKIFYQLDGASETIVFIHGFSLDQRMWIPQIEYFSKNFQVLSYDMRGYGKSSLPAKKYSHHEDLKELLDRLKLTKINLVGLSLGGEISVDFTIAYPDYVKSLTLLDSSISGYKSTVDWDVHAKEESLEKAKENWLNHPVFKQSIKNSDVKKILENIIKDYSGWHWLHESLSKRLEPPAKVRLGEIKIPVITIVGELDLSYYHDISKFIERNVEDSIRMIIPGAGHMVNLENPKMVNQIIARNIGNNQ